MDNLIQVLIVDDEVAIRKTIKNSLYGFNCVFFYAKSGERALELIRENHFDVIFLDIRLKGISGIETFKSAKQIKPNIGKVIIMTGFSDIEPAFEAGKLRVFHYLKKADFTVESIRNIFRVALEKSSISVEPSVQIFLSYARLDKKIVAELYEKLTTEGFKPWMDTEDILAGENFRLAIEKAIRNSDFFFACLTKNSVDRRGFIQRELKEVLDLWKEKLDSDIYLIPVRLEECKAPESLQGFQWVDLFEENGWAKLLRAIQEGIRRRTSL